MGRLQSVLGPSVCRSHLSPNSYGSIIDLSRKYLGRVIKVWCIIDLAREPLNGSGRGWSGRAGPTGSGRV
eukprot:9253291-Pyramimonas_sp.AAC.1